MLLDSETPSHIVENLKRNQLYSFVISNKIDKPMIITSDKFQIA